MSKSFDAAVASYAALGVDVEKAFKRLDSIAVSMHCWQGDDVQGFENSGALDGGLAVTGNYPGRARNAEELRKDLEFALTLIPGKKRLNLHAIYAESAKKTDRAALTDKDFANWIKWAKEHKMGLDFNPTIFSHPMMKNGLSLTHPDKAVRNYWIKHCIGCRRIGEAIGKALKNPCVTNIWIPDGFKDTPYDRLSPRARLKDSLDAIFAEKIDEKYNRDAVESKLFGIGAESCTFGSSEFYLGYAVQNKKLLCLDAGHFHPTEVISDKISSCLLFLDEILLHVSRGVRWDSDHVITLNDELQAIASEIVRHNFEKRVHIGLDYFDASINRIAAWTIGMRNMSKALLMAMLEPAALLKKAENSFDFTGRLALLEECRTLDFAPVWNEYCSRAGVPVGTEWLEAVRKYEAKVLSKRK